MKPQAFEITTCDFALLGLGAMTAARLLRSPATLLAVFKSSSIDLKGTAKAWLAAMSERHLERRPPEMGLSAAPTGPPTANEESHSNDSAQPRCPRPPSDNKKPAEHRATRRGV